MFRKTVFLVALSALGLSACTTWPTHGHGGAAEHHLQHDEPLTSNTPLDPENKLRFEMDLLNRHLDVLVIEGAKLCFPATVVQAEHRQDRIARELHGGLEFDAANDLIVQRKILARLERQLDYVKSQGVCSLPIASGKLHPADLGKRLHELLNADNQFATDSAEINPKYMGRLSEAAHLLQDYPAFRLRIVGHTDSRGTESHNRSLSMSRARQVSRYLQIFGIARARIDVDAVASDDPLFPGDADHVRLTNRRVSVELIEIGRAKNSAME